MGTYATLQGTVNLLLCLDLSFVRPYMWLDRQDIERRQQQVHEQMPVCAGLHLWMVDAVELLEQVLQIKQLL
jgi:hypothetical protein